MTDVLRTDWMSYGACVGQDSSLWFPADGERAESAEGIPICMNECPVRIRCLEYALGTYEQYGIWGGLTFKQRRTVLTRRRKEARKR